VSGLQRELQGEAPSYKAHDGTSRQGGGLGGRSRGWPEERHRCRGRRKAEDDELINDDSRTQRCIQMTATATKTSTPTGEKVIRYAFDSAGIICTGKLPSAESVIKGRREAKRSVY